MRGLLATLVVLAHGAAYAAPRVAIYPLRSVGTSPEAMQQLEAALRIELQRAQALEIAEGPVPAKLRDCKAETPCLLEYGRTLGAQEVLSGEVRALPDSYSVTLRVLDVATGKETGKTAGSYNRDVEEMVWAARAHVARLKAPHRYAGQLVIEAKGATATVNDSAIKSGVPLVLRPGLHEVRVKSGKNSVQAWIEVRFEQTATVRLSGEPAQAAATYTPWVAPERVEFAQVPAPRNPPEDIDLLAPLVPPTEHRPVPAAVGGQPGWPKWPGIVAILGGLALAGGGVYELVHASALESEVKSLRGPTNEIPTDRRAEARTKLDEMNAARTIGVALSSVGGALVVGGSAYLFFAPSAGGAQVAVGGSF
ncbi:MAG: hypothetical protein HY901_04435 [Deltaproteobacteria bacterium]|nr:hypothetical protein [Deltaproteobacteria bacterium]